MKRPTYREKEQQPQLVCSWFLLSNLIRHTACQMSGGIRVEHKEVLRITPRRASCCRQISRRRVGALTEFVQFPISAAVNGIRSNSDKKTSKRRRGSYLVDMPE